MDKKTIEALASDILYDAVQHGFTTFGLQKMAEHLMAFAEKKAAAEVPTDSLGREMYEVKIRPLARTTEDDRFLVVRYLRTRDREWNYGSESGWKTEALTTMGTWVRRPEGFEADPETTHVVKAPTDLVVVSGITASVLADPDTEELELPPAEPLPAAPVKKPRAKKAD